METEKKEEQKKEQKVNYEYQLVHDFRVILSLNWVYPTSFILGRVFVINIHRTIVTYKK